MKHSLLLILFVLCGLFSFSQNSVTLINGKIYFGRIYNITDSTLQIKEKESGIDYQIKMKNIKKYSYESDTHKVVSDSFLRNYYLEQLKDLPAGNEVIKAQKLFVAGIVVSGIGILTAVGIPYGIEYPEYDGSTAKYTEEVNEYNKKVKAVVIIGCGFVLAGTILELASMSHFRLAGEILNLSTSKDGLSLSMKIK